MNKFGERLRELRIDNGYSRAQLATNLNVSARLIAYWENGQRECSFDALINIAEFFGTSTDFILGKSDY